MDKNWANLGFDIQQTNSYVKYTYKNGSWDNGELVRNQEITLPVYCAALHYGQTCFEGLKAFRSKEGKIRIFRPDLNAIRLQESCKMVAMPYPSVDLFLEAIVRLVEDNKEFVPPYDCNGSMYIRPLVFGSGQVLGLVPADEYHFLVLGNPVGEYYKGGMSPCKALIQYGFDRAAPNGMGRAKVAGNYAPVIPVTEIAKEKGFTINLFLDPKQGTFIEEFATSNFIALTKTDEKITFVTPKSKSILLSITNRTLTELAVKHFGWNVERRKIRWSEVMDGTFDEIAACGTAVVITPVNEIHREYPLHAPTETVSTCIDTLWEDDKDDVDIQVEIYKASNASFEGFQQLYDVYRGIQKGDLPDTFQWLYPPNGIE
jgi:branched-chain amino acid aminotransferase